MKLPGLAERTVGDVAWTLEEPFAEALAREVLPHVHALASLPQARLVKRSLQRTVHQVPLPDGSRAIVKEYRLRNWRQRLKRRLLGPKPLIEWGASRRLRELGIPASHAIAVGLPAARSRDIEGYLVVEALPDVIGMGAHLQALAAPSPEATARAHEGLLRSLARFVRTLHDRGISHHDLHWGNILVRPEPPSPGEGFMVIDLHRIAIGAPPGPRHRAESIAQLLLSFGDSLAQDRPARTGAFLEAYLAAGGPIKAPQLSQPWILAAMGRRAARRLASRARRCIKESTAYTVETHAGWRIWHRRDYSPEAILALWTQRTSAPANSAPRASGPLELREYPPRGPLARLFGRIIRSPAVRDYAAAHRAWLEAGAGPQAIAAAECRRGPHKGRSFTILEPPAR